MTNTAEPSADAVPTYRDQDLADGSQPPPFRIVQRTIIRPDQELDLRPLYIGGMSGFGSVKNTSRQSGAGEDEVPVTDSADVADGNAVPVEALRSFGAVSNRMGVTARRSGRVTFGTYFNAFPASYWRRWTPLRTVKLIVRMAGQGSIIVYRSSAKGHVQRVDSGSIDSLAPQTIEFELTLQPFIDGGWYWFDIEAGDGEVSLEEAVWGFETDRLESGTVSIGITTYNRPDFCVDQLMKLSDEPEVLEILDEILVVDQGSQRVRDHELYGKASAALGSKLRVIEQGNLGGSGGFSRAMAETTTKGSADYVLLLDDDVVCELEGILRAVAFADLAKKPTIVGGQMFSLSARSNLHAFGETVAKYRWFWGPAPNTWQGHDFAIGSLPSTEWLHRRVDVDYNGWWMCLIPTSVIRQVGLSLPMFLKWDDAEYGLRASEAGYPTVTLPGVAVWHVPWHEKDDTTDWQAYFHRRNRIITALLHSPYERGGRLIWESFDMQVKHLLSMQYGPAEMGLMAIEDILEGPQRMHRDVLQRLPELNQLRKGYDDSRSEPDLDRFPPTRRRKPPRKGKQSTAPTGRLGKVKVRAAIAVRQVMPVRETARQNPEVSIQHIDLKWWLVSQFDSALVSSGDGTVVAWYKRRPELFRDLLSRSVSVHVRLAKEWPRLVKEYKEALPELSAPKTWQQTFEESTKKDAG